MSRTIFLVRHGQASAAWNQNPDPGLSALGREQAQAVCDHFAPGPIRPLFTSPLLRARETAQPLAEHWQQVPVIMPAFAEIPAPANYPVEQRLQWLLALRDCRWPDADASLHDWRTAILDALAALPDGAIVFTHFMVMNVVVGAATASDALVCYQPDNTSVLELAVSGKGDVGVVALGRQAQTRVL